MRSRWDDSILLLFDCWILYIFTAPLAPIHTFSYTSYTRLFLPMLATGMLVLPCFLLCLFDVKYCMLNF